MIVFVVIAPASATGARAQHWPSGQCVCKVGLPWPVEYVKQVACKGLLPTHFLPCQGLCGEEVGQCLVISQDLGEFWGALKVMLLMLAGHHNGKHFLLMCGISLFGKGHLL